MSVHILLVRHGFSAGNDNPALYSDIGDTGIHLTETGWRQVAGSGKFLKTYCQEAGMTEWPLFYLSPMQRTKESTSGILHGMKDAFPGEPKIHVQSFLTEKFFGAASALHFPEGKVPPALAADLLALSKTVHRNDPFTAKHLFGESTKDTMVAAKLLIDGSLRRDIEEGKNNIVIVAHGKVIEAIMMLWGHYDPQDWKNIGKVGNGDVIEISGEPKNWAIRQIYDGQKGEAVTRLIEDNIRPYGLTDLPPVPDFLKLSGP